MMGGSEEKHNLKRKHKASLLPNNIKTENVSELTQSVRILIQKIHKDQHSSEDKSSIPRIRKLLVRSLGSSNVQVQKNYFAVLVALMKSSETSAEFTIDHILNTVESELHITGNIAKGEEGEILIGKVLAFGVMVRSGCLARAPADDQSSVVTQVMRDIKGKSYLPLIADPFIIEYLTQIEEPLFREAIWDCFSREVEPGPSQSLLLYHILLVCKERFPSVLTAKYLKQTLNSSTILSTTTVPALIVTLKNNFKMKTTNHTVYVDIFKYLANSSDQVLQCFWKGVEADLLTDDAVVTNNKPIMGLKFFSLIISNLQQISKVELLLTPRVLSWFMKKHKISGRSQKTLYLTSKEALDNLYQFCAKDKNAEAAANVIPKLLLDPGNVLFEMLSGTRIIQQLMSLLKEGQVFKIAKMLKSVIMGNPAVSDNKGDKSPARPLYNKEKLYTVHIFCRLVSLPAVHSNLQWRLEQLTFLFDLGFFSTGNNIGVELASHIRDSFFSCLNHKLGNLVDLRNILAGIVEHINKRLAKEDELRIKVQSEVMPAWEKMCETASKIGESKKHKKQKWVPSIFQTMFYHIGLHLFKESAFATDILQELHSVYQRVGSSSSSEEEPHWTEVVVEMFLSLLSRNSQLHRHLIGCIFSHFCPIMIPQNIHQILQILDPTSNSNPLLDSLDPDSDSSSDVDSDADDVDDEDKESSDDGMTDEDEEEDGQDEKVNDKLRRAILDALGDAGAQTDVESVDLDQMGDEEAARVDRALSQAFKAVKPNSGKSKKQPSHAKALLHFRLRVLDLIEVWLASEPPLDLVVDTLLRLITLLEHSLVDRYQAPLETRLRSVIKKLTTIKKYKTSDCQDLHLGTILKSLLDRGDRTTTVYMSVTQELKASTLFIVKASQHIGESENEEEEESETGNLKVLSVLKEIVKSFFLQRDCLLPVDLFQGIFNLNLPSICKIASKLPNYVFDPNVHPFRRSKALEFIITFWRNNRILSESNEEHTHLLRKMSKRLHKGSEKMMEEPFGRVQPKFINLLRQAFNIIKQRKWLQDVDWPQHMQALAQFQKTHVVKKEKKVSAEKEDSVKIEEMEIDNKPEENDQSGESSDKESADEEQGENSSQKKQGEQSIIKDEENDSGLEEEGSQLESEDKLSDSDEPPGKRSKKTEKKKSHKQIKRRHLLKNNSNKLRLESMSAGLQENVFSKYKLLATSTLPTSPER